MFEREAGSTSVHHDESSWSHDADGRAWSIAILRNGASSCVLLKLGASVGCQFRCETGF